MKSLSTFDIFADMEARNPRNSEGSFVTLKSGRILFVWSCYEGERWDDGDAANLALAYSDDEGATWTRDGILVKREEGVDNIMSVSLLRLASGRIVLVYVKKTTNEFGSPYGIPYCKYSDDEAQTWSDEIRIAHSNSYIVVNNDRLIQLSSGRLLLAGSVHVPYHCDKSNDVRWRASYVQCFYSDDQGEHWYDTYQQLFSPPILQCGTGWQEPGLVELEEHKVMMWMRTDMGFQCSCTSDDDGWFWTEPIINKNFPCPVSPMSVKRNPWDKSLVAVWNDNSRRWGITIKDGDTVRNPLALAVSRDNGVTWGEHYLVDTGEQRGFCYTAMHFVNHKLLLAYCCGLHVDSKPGEKSGGGGTWGGKHCQLQDLRIRVLDLEG